MNAQQVKDDITTCEEVVESEMSRAETAADIIRVTAMVFRWGALKMTLLGLGPEPAPPPPPPESRGVLLKRLEAELAEADAELTATQAAAESANQPTLPVARELARLHLLAALKAQEIRGKIEALR